MPSAGQGRGPQTVAPAPTKVVTVGGRPQLVAPPKTTQVIQAINVTSANPDGTRNYVVTPVTTSYSSDLDARTGGVSTGAAPGIIATNAATGTTGTLAAPTGGGWGGFGGALSSIGSAISNAGSSVASAASGAFSSPSSIVQTLAAPLVAPVAAVVKPIAPSAAPLVSPVAAISTGGKYPLELASSAAQAAASLGSAVAATPATIIASGSNFGSLLDSVVNAVAQPLSAVGNIASAIPTSSVGDAIATAGQQTVGAFSGGGAALVDLAQNVAPTVSTAVEQAGGAFSGLSGVAQSAGSALSTAAHQASGLLSTPAGALALPYVAALTPGGREQLGETLGPAAVAIGGSLPVVGPIVNTAVGSGVLGQIPGISDFWDGLLAAFPAPPSQPPAPGYQGDTVSDPATGLPEPERMPLAVIVLASLAVAGVGFLIIRK